jgi:hypothetical protein
MSRESTVRVSDGEKESLDVAREDIFGTDEVPYGTVIQALVDNYFEDG